MKTFSVVLLVEGNNVQHMQHSIVQAIDEEQALGSVIRDTGRKHFTLPIKLHSVQAIEGGKDEI